MHFYTPAVLSHRLGRIVMIRSCEYMRQKGYQRLTYCTLTNQYVDNCSKRECEAYKKAKGTTEVKRITF